MNMISNAPMTLEQFSEIVTPVYARPGCALRYETNVDLSRDSQMAARVRVMYKRWLREEGYLPLANKPAAREPRQMELFA